MASGPIPGGRSRADSLSAAHPAETRDAAETRPASTPRTAPRTRTAARPTSSSSCRGSRSLGSGSAPGATDRAQARRIRAHDRIEHPLISPSACHRTRCPRGPRSRACRRPCPRAAARRSARGSLWAAVNPTITKSPVRSALILSHASVRPPRYFASARLAMMPSSPSALTDASNRLALALDVIEHAHGRRVWGSLRAAALCAPTSGSGRRSKSSNAMKSNTKNVAGSSTAARLTSSGIDEPAPLLQPRKARLALRRPVTTTSPSMMHSSNGSACTARAISGKTAV